MAFKKGTSGNPSGKPKGAINKRTKEQREAYDSIMELIEQRMLDGDDVINSLSPARAAELYVNLVNFKKPKLSAAKVDADVNTTGEVKIILEYNSGTSTDDNKRAEDGE